MTVRGFTTLTTGIAALLAGRVFGLLEVIAIGLVLIGLVVFSFVVVVFPRGRLALARRLRPERITVGQAAHIDLRLEQRGRLSSGILRLQDGVSNTAGAELRSTPVPAKHTRLATYRVQPPARGVVTIGPLEVERLDPFGLARRRIATLDVSDLVVHPQILPIAAPTRPRAVDLASSISVPQQELRGDDFHALRLYELGDDLRRVHWKATARHDELMIREHDDSREGRTTVVADVRASAVSAAALERILVAAASILDAAATRGDEVSLILTDGSGPHNALDRRGLTPLLDVLARVQLAPGISGHDKTLQVLRANQRSGGLVTLLGDGDKNEHAASLSTGFQAHLPFVFAFRDDDSSGVTDDFGDRWTAEIQRRSTAEAHR
jgi:uncharacterized protein (DUF58 family)